jgi:formylglycine-generating enzyme required for sulfatase activity
VSLQKWAAATLLLVTACGGVVEAGDGHLGVKVDGGMLDRWPAEASAPAEQSDASDASGDFSDATLCPGDAVPPSCSTSGPGITDCGHGKESCCTSLEVKGGTYFRTYSNGGAGPTGEADPATISDFRLDKYLVTVGRFRQFVSAWNNGYTPAAESGKHRHLNGGRGLINGNTDAGALYEPGWLTSDDANATPTFTSLNCGSATVWGLATWTSNPGTQENLPINCVNWYQAYAFCIWDGGFLPSEAEWEYAAAGGSEQREFPWGSTAPGVANQYAIYGCLYPAGSAACTIAPVGTATLGAGRWGQLDLAGEVFEWNVDWFYGQNSVANATIVYFTPCLDCANLTPDWSRVVRGGEFDYAWSAALPTFRNNEKPAMESSMLGFRCARTPCTQ